MMIKMYKKITSRTKTIMFIYISFFLFCSITMESSLLAIIIGWLFAFMMCIYLCHRDITFKPNKNNLIHEMLTNIKNDKSP